MDELLPLVSSESVAATFLLDLDELRQRLDLYAFSERLDELDVDIRLEKRGADCFEREVQRLGVRAFS